MGLSMCETAVHTLMFLELKLLRLNEMLHDAMTSHSPSLFHAKLIGATVVAPLLIPAAGSLLTNRFMVSMASCSDNWADLYSDIHCGESSDGIIGDVDEDGTLGKVRGTVYWTY